jgi:hypothetical protein
MPYPARVFVFVFMDRAVSPPESLGLRLIAQCFLTEVLVLHRDLL